MINIDLYGLALAHLGKYPREKSISPYKNVHISKMNSIVHKSPKVETTQIPSANKQVNKMWYIQIIEYYSAIKKNEVLILAKTCLKLVCIMLIERNQ
jgi:hypothetical protein